ncbi:MAG: HNH endonuclease, partial [Candidatus Riesia sp.]|nr:HNH endonuclease [Candidatus Riesia sp.]
MRLSAARNHTSRMTDMYIKARGFQPGKSCWAMDHIIPVHRGGGSCGLWNLQTLCLPCHKKKTAEDRETTWVEVVLNRMQVKHIAGEITAEE